MAFGGMIGDALDTICINIIHNVITTSNKTYAPLRLAQRLSAPYWGLVGRIQGVYIHIKVSFEQ